LRDDARRHRDGKAVERNKPRFVSMEPAELPEQELRGGAGHAKHQQHPLRTPAAPDS
jgi:hypothetical protein